MVNIIKQVYPHPIVPAQTDTAELSTLMYFSSGFNRSLELVPYGIKPLLRRAAAYEAMERYRQAYVDYKTALQINCNLPAAHDGTNR